MTAIGELLSDKEFEAVERFMRQVGRRFGNRLIEARLFGSKARREAGEESDVDLWLLFDRELSAPEQELLVELESDLCIDTGVMLNLATFSVAQWEYPPMQITGFAQAIREEGVPL